jgi:hypothetical protein
MARRCIDIDDVDDVAGKGNRNKVKAILHKQKATAETLSQEQKDKRYEAELARQAWLAEVYGKVGGNE